MDTAGSAIRVCIVERYPLFASALAELLPLTGVLAVAGIARTPREASFSSNNADVIVWDIDSDPGDPETAAHVFQKACGGIPVCALSTRPDPELMRRCLSAGMAGFIVKDVSVTAFISAIESIGMGGRYVDPRLAPAPVTELSPRETDILRLISQGMSNRDIGRRLLLSEKTVKNYVSRIFSKLHVSKRSQAALHATKNGLA
jgi:DNA-binding NarL/FixJ family response regulator